MGGVGGINCIASQKKKKKKRERKEERGTNDIINQGCGVGSLRLQAKRVQEFETPFGIDYCNQVDSQPALWNSDANPLRALLSPPRKGPKEKEATHLPQKSPAKYKFLKVA